MRERTKKVYGVGINDTKHQVQRKGEGYICPVYLKWRNMLQRCYSKNSYTNCKVCDNWKIFSNFQNWVNTLEIEDLSNFHLDKDLLGDGSIYDEDSCCFLHPIVNTFITNSVNSLNLKGCTLDKRGGKLIYNVQVRNPLTKKKEHLGRVYCVAVGHKMWVARKKEILEDIITQGLVTDNTIQEALRVKIDTLMESLK